MATSAIPTFKAALYARLGADGGLSSVNLTYGMPSVPPDRNWVMVGNARPEDGTGLATGGQVTAAMGQRRREERWVQEIIVSCTSPIKDSQQTLTELAFTYAATIENSLRTWSAMPNPFTGAGVRWALVTGMELTEHVSSTDREARILIDVSCAERI